MKTTTINGIKISRTIMRNNILRVWYKTTEQQRYDWYYEAYKWGVSCLHTANMQFSEENMNKVCGVIAALSPVKSWDQNKKIALDFILTGKCGHFKSLQNKALMIMNSTGECADVLRILNGQKIKAFYHNIRYTHKSNLVTIDRHAVRVAINYYFSDKDGIVSPEQNKMLQWAYISAAEKVGVSPSLIQSATWVYIRQNKQMLKRLKS